MSESQIVDAELVPDQQPPDREEEQQAPGRQLERRPVTNEVLMPMDPDQVVAGMTAYQQLLPRLLDASDYQAAGKDRDGKPRKFVKKSGWRKIARAFNLSVEIVAQHVERDDTGTPTSAHVVARAVGPNGSFQDGDGYCSIDEKRFQDSLRDPGKRDKLKLENDLRATATTRAKNRAISDLVGMGEVSAEEMTPGGVPGASTMEASDELKGRASKALTFLLGQEQAEKTWGEIKTALSGVMAEPAAQAIVIVAEAVKKSKRKTAQPTADKPEATVEVATAAQRRKVMARFRANGLADERFHRAILTYVAGTPHLDRVPKAKVDQLIEAIEDHQGTLAEIHDRASGGDAEAKKIVDQHLKG